MVTWPFISGVGRRFKSIDKRHIYIYVVVCVYMGGGGGSGGGGAGGGAGVCLSDIILNIGPKVGVFLVFLLSGCSILFPFFIRNVNRSFHCMNIAYSVFGEVLFAWVSFQPKGSTSSMTRRATL